MKASDNKYPKVILTEQGSTPSNPDAGDQKLFIRTSDHALCLVNSSGSVSAVGGTGGGYTEGVRAEKSSAQTLTGSSGTAVTWNQEAYDTDSMHSTVTNTSRLTCTTAGKYLITSCLRFAANATGHRGCYYQAHIGSSDYYLAADRRLNCGASFPTDIVMSTVYDFGVGDYVEIYAEQDSGGNLDISEVVSNFCMQRIG